ncbi:23S rRNA (guanosine-2'-O-)-methyltransferase RlmB [bacterium BMS3Abin08]|nr:23S rRNA (guanosine-2'-O-)-methyltransferase RlmB [bacterium BMS3Abin08]
MREVNWLHGLNPVKEALRGKRKVLEVYLQRGKSEGSKREVLSLCASLGIKTSYVDRSFFSSFPKGHQGIAARTGSLRSYSLHDLEEITTERGASPLYLLLDGIVDPRNLGAIIRTAEAAGIHAVITEKRRTATGETVAKTSAGALEYLPLIRVPNIKHAIKFMKEEGVTVFGAEADGERDYWSFDLRGPVALVLGSEGKGLRETVRKACDYTLRIPLLGRVGSLNVAVAAGVLVYEILRQRRGKEAESSPSNQG